MRFDTRADLSEWMDEPCSFEDFRDCLRDLAQVNRMTLAYQPTLRWLRTVAGQVNGPLHIVDVGCGGGDMLRKIERWAADARIAVRLTGIDLNPHAARAAREMTPAGCSIEWITGDVFTYAPAVPIDCVISSLFTHHLPRPQIAAFLAWMERVTQVGWFINDLHRERLPYFGFQALAAIMRWHRFVRHDGPVSIRRAFRPEDWQGMLRDAGLQLQQVQLLTSRPARLCVSRVKV